ncbi:DUF4190 domain-containing protein [Solirubrobacter sp. CPCC 204708]|uniref:DUF4190 domain-containing protein n=1 Tax=Solirubrobacter deserti TaxID=2282478 RepID=A0ABT4RKU1_9ACTN|nr:DUF4190 domain-containing protein [Solirubrobacter deserti]MBE2319070.1 DUF4190 domain-containing protein [Solirubrobacter deserti]MDA0139149.1 DUF4190 domain-containing protein [Solirubrobacter deserti]
MSWQPPPYPPPQQQSNAAVVSLVLGICGLVVCPLVCSVAALVYASKAFTEIDSSGGRLTGRDLAKAGQVLGWVGVALCVLGLLFVVGVIGLGEALNDDSYEYEPVPEYQVD